MAATAAALGLRVEVAGGGGSVGGGAVEGLLEFTAALRDSGTGEAESAGE